MPTSTLHTLIKNYCQTENPPDGADFLVASMDQVIIQIKNAITPTKTGAFTMQDGAHLSGIVSGVKFLFFIGRTVLNNIIFITLFVKP